MSTPEPIMNRPAPMITAYHAQYFAHELTKRCPPGSGERLVGAVVSAQVDLNPHQVDAALFAFQSPLSKGALLADEVGLGKTIEAGLVLPQMKGFIVSEILGMLNRSGYKHKRSKHSIAASGSLMRITGLNVNAERPTIPKDERNIIRVMVFKRKQMFDKVRRCSCIYRVLKKRVRQGCKPGAFSPSRGKETLATS